MYDIVSIGLLFVGLLLALGTAGASDCGTISTMQCNIQGLISIALVIIGWVMLRFRKEDRSDDQG